MTNKKISILTSVSVPLAGTEVIPIVQSSETKNVTVADLTAGRNVAARTLTLTGGNAGNLIVDNDGSQYVQILLRRNGVANSGGDILLNGTGGQISVRNLVAGTIALATGTSLGSAVDRITVAPAGDVTLNTGNLVQGTAAKGINFTANTPAAGMTSQLLNWYEEGTWTPALTPGTSGTITPGSRGGLYTRVGRQVTVTGYIDVTSVSAPVGSLLLTGLPFTIGAALGNRSAASIHTTGLAAAATTSVIGRLVSGESQIRIDKYAAGTASALAADVNNTTVFHFSATYFV